jgi:CheY-like chemotaxis protein
LFPANRGEGRDGVEAAVLIRKQYDIPALFVSAQSSCGLAARASEAKPLGWLSKPFDKRQLLSAIEKARSMPRSKSSSATSLVAGNQDQQERLEVDHQPRWPGRSQ